MVELPFVFVAGVLGSSHCIGMCGPFALAIGSGSPGWLENLRRQAVYSLGRIFTYATLGAVAGFGGLRLARAAPSVINFPALLAIVAGALLVYQGLASAGVLGKRSTPAAAPCFASVFFSSFLGPPGRRSMFLAGMFTGMLPCGLVYAFLALAASSAGVFRGAAIMAMFGLGTVPVMTLTGVGGALLEATARRRLFRLAAWCVVISGIVSMARGVGFARLPGAESDESAAQCPFCSPNEAPLLPAK